MKGIYILSILISILVLSYLVYVILEKVYVDKIRKSFKYVIHVNGTRGKSTTTRLIDAGFRELGYKVFSKTTGTLPTYIDTLNQEHVIKRLGKANIREQIRMMKKAYKEGAEVLVLECMAVNPELQYVSEHRILRSNVCVITNVRMDHLGVMGDTKEEIAKSLSNTIPEAGVVIIHDAEFYDLFKAVADKTASTVVCASPLNEDVDIDTFKDNIENALEVSRVLNLDTDKFKEGMKKYHHDMGAWKVIKMKDTIFINALSMNDPESIKMSYQNAKEKYGDDITILLNSRPDRGERLLQHIEMLKDMKFKKLIISGSNQGFIKNKLKNLDISIEVFESCDKLLEENIIFATGNIASDGMKILEYFKKGGTEYDI